MFHPYNIVPNRWFNRLEICSNRYRDNKMGIERGEAKEYWIFEKIFYDIIGENIVCFLNKNKIKENLIAFYWNKTIGIMVCLNTCKNMMNKAETA